MKYTLPFTLLILLLLGGLGAARAEEATYAERLGWPKGARVVIFHVDDAGMSHESNLGAIEAIEKGVATSTSIMMPCGWVPEFAAYCQTHPQLDAGLHITMNSEWKTYRWGPVAGPRAVPSLVDPSGYLWHGPQQTIFKGKADEVELEIRAQLDKALALGLKPTHLDSHMGTVLYSPAFYERYLKVGAEKHIPVMIYGGRDVHQQKTALDFMRQGAAERAWAAGLPVLDDLVGNPSKAPDLAGKKRDVMALLHGLKPGLTQVIVHCTETTDAFRAISSSGGNRLTELQLMTDPELKAFLKKEGIILTTWRELKERRDRVGGAKPRVEGGVRSAEKASHKSS